MGAHKLTQYAMVAVVLGLVLMAAGTEGRHAARRAHPEEGHALASQRALPHAPKQGRIFHDPIALKKLLLLKFKKVLPIKLILLKSNNANEAELVPVYPTSEIPPNVQFIPTPNGISGHKDVQAIAIPSELHEQLQAQGIENIDSLLQQTDMEEDNAVDSPQPEIVVEDQLLNIKEDDLSQPLTPIQPSALKSRRVAFDHDSSHRPARTSPLGDEVPLIMYAPAPVRKAGRTRIYDQGRRHHRHHQ